MNHTKLLKIVSLLSILTVLSANPTIAETSSDSLAAPSKLRFALLISPMLAAYPVLSINQNDLKRVYDASNNLLNASLFSYADLRANFNIGFSAGFSLTHRINDRLNVNISPSINFFELKITSTLSVKPIHESDFRSYTRMYKTSLPKTILELPISLETIPFKSKPGFLTSAGLSFKYDFAYYSEEIILELTDAPFFIIKRYFFDFFLSTKFLKPKKQNGVEFKFSYSLRDIIHRTNPQPHVMFLPVNSIHLFTSSLLFHIR